MVGIDKAGLHWLAAGGNFHPLEECAGYDLNRNGAAEWTECADLNADSSVSEAEWKAYLELNRSAIEPAGPFFKHYYAHGQAFGPQNPLHDLLQIESELASDEEIAGAYRAADRMLNELQKNLPLFLKKKSQPRRRGTFRAMFDVFGIVLTGAFRTLFSGYALAEKRYLLKEASKVMRYADGKISFGAADLLSKGIARRRLDCDTSSMLMLGLGHEMGWPLHLVVVPEHSFVRWDDGAGTRINVDQGHITADETYMTWPRELALESVNEGVYLKNATYRETLSQMYSMRSNAKGTMGMFKEAIVDLDQAIALNPKNTLAHLNRGDGNMLLNRNEEAISDYDRLIQLDPKSAVACEKRGYNKYILGKFEAAIIDFDEAIRLNPKHAFAYHNRGSAKLTLKMTEEAIYDFDEAARLNPRNPFTYHNRGMAKRSLGKHEEAVADFNEAAEINPHDASIFTSRGISNFELARYEEAVADFNEALKLDPKDGDARSYRHKAMRALKRK